MRWAITITGRERDIQRVVDAFPDLSAGDSVKEAVLRFEDEWDELTDDLDLHAFTIRTLPARLAERGDLWGPVMKRPIPLRRFLRAAPAA